jgi:DegV family protein with EDD domain
MKRIAIITDTDSSLPADVADRYGIRQVPITIQFGDESYAAGVDIDDRLLFQKIDLLNKLPTTAAPSPGAFAAAYEGAFSGGADEVVCICVSSKISATYASALTACQNFPEKKITVLDSLCVSMGQGFMAIKAAEMAQAGANVDQILAEMEDMRGRMSLFAVLATLKYLAMSGRVGKLAAGLANTLDIKPILTMQDGKLDLLEKIRTRTKAVERVIELGGQSLNGRSIERAAFVHVAAPDGARALQEQFCRTIGSPGQVMTIEFSPGLSVHTGSGVVGFILLGGK